MDAVSFGYGVQFLLFIGIVIARPALSAEAISKAGLLHFVRNDNSFLIHLYFGIKTPFSVFSVAKKNFFHACNQIWSTISLRNRLREREDFFELKNLNLRKGKMCDG